MQFLETQGKSESPPLSPLRNKEHTYRVQWEKPVHWTVPAVLQELCITSTTGTTC